MKFFFWKYYFEYKLFYICPDVPVGIIRVFLISDFLAERLKANKKRNKDHRIYTYFIWQWKQYVTNTAKNLSDYTNFPANMFLFGVWKNICTAPFLDAQELHLWSTLKVNVCIFLYIPLRKYLFQKHSKVLSGSGWSGFRLNNFLKAENVFPKCFTMFHFNWNFKKFNCFLAFRYFYL